MSILPQKIVSYFDYVDLRTEFNKRQKYNYDPRHVISHKKYLYLLICVGGLPFKSVWKRTDKQIMRRHCSAARI